VTRRFHYIAHTPQNQQLLVGVAVPGAQATPDTPALYTYKREGRKKVLRSYGEPLNGQRPYSLREGDPVEVLTKRRDGPEPGTQATVVAVCEAEILVGGIPTLVECATISFVGTISDEEVRATVPAFTILPLKPRL